ncbi:DUF1648 domain-containing protein [Flavihumibacter sp. UBA7668]|uniref:DUF1648 domain-containing protein n=1 Tax=Flavihumibacter sp. UBA7668 TaxID=1946542 RepID=UPI0025BFF4EF|nr:DUF1648 domain-containing protein [Flavihumibacter sp. UBA7668]
MCALPREPEKPLYFTILTVASIILLLANWILAIIEYPSLPSVIPSHFNSIGTVDGYSNKVTVFLLPSVASFTLLILLLVAGQLNPMREARILKVIGFLTALLFLLIEVFLLYAAKTGHTPQHFYLVFMLSGIMVIYPFIEMIVDRKRQK